MQMANGNRWVWIIGLTLAMAAISQGCGSRPEMAERNVVVSLDDTLARATAVEVNVIGVNDTEFPRYANRPVDDYWRGGGRGKGPRGGAGFKGSGNPRRERVGRADPG